MYVANQILNEIQVGSLSIKSSWMPARGFMQWSSGSERCEEDAEVTGASLMKASLVTGSFN